MIRHIVMWKLKTWQSERERSEWAARLEASVAAMRAQVPGLLRAWTGFGQVQSQDASDLVLFCEFVSWEALHGYDAHPAHMQFRALVGPLRTERRVLDCEVADEA